jgi:hypothetical protein
MVLKAQIGGYDIGRVFMDAGSGINLIYARTLREMCISLDSLKPTDCSFHGIVPGSANYPFGKIELDVCFGNSSNYRKEKLEFEVMDWPSQYHAIQGRPPFAKFMAVPHYAYLTLKIPGPRGTITVQGSFEVTLVTRNLSVFWIPGYPGPPAPGPRHRPIFSPGDNQRCKSRRRPSRGGAS